MAATALGLLLAGSWIPGTWAAEVLDLFTARKELAEPRELNAVQGADKPAYLVILNLEALESGVIQPGMRLQMEPAPGLVLTAQVSRADLDINGTLGILAPILGHDHAYLALSYADGVALGDVRLPDQQRRYAIQLDAPTQRHVARDVHDQELDELPPGPAVYPPAPDAPAPSAPHTLKEAFPSDEPAVPDDPATPATIDLMIVYTPAAANWANANYGSIQTLVNQAMIRSQLALDNSNVGITLHLSHAAQVSYTESGTSLTDLGRLQKTSDGYMDEIHGWRTTYGADLVALLADVQDTGGLGYALTGSYLPGGFPTYAFSLTRVRQAHNTYTLIHELGHNMGAGHHKLQNVQPGPQAYSYSAGWRWVGTNAARYCSIMSYEQGSYFADGQTHARVPYFSSPSISYHGLPTGHAVDGDNARTLRETKHITAAYRASVRYPDFWFRALSLDNRVMLRWENPTQSGAGSSNVMIRFSTSGYPASTNAGTLVYQGTAQAFLHTNGIVTGQPHYYAIWVSDDGSTFIEP